MSENNKSVLIYSTFPSPEDAERVGGVLVERGLAACVNIFASMTAIYIWEGKRQRETEAAMLIKPVPTWQSRWCRRRESCIPTAIRL